MNKEKVSNYITYLNVILTIMIVLLHSDCSYMLDNQAYISIGVFRALNTIYDLAVPSFFIISAYLFYININDLKAQYLSKIGGRISSLIIPYFIYSFLWMFMYTLLGLLPGIGDMIPDSAINSSLTENVIAFLRADYDPPIWYLRTLFGLQLISPLIYIIIQKGKWIGLVCSIVIWVLNCVILPGYSTMLFWLPVFIIGVWWALYLDEMCCMIEKMSWKLLVVLIALLYVMAVMFSAENQSNAIYYTWRTAGSCLILLCLSKVEMLNKKKLHFAKCTFFVFMVHYPIIQMIKRLLSKIITVDSLTVWLVYVLTALIGLLICIMMGYIIKRIIPGFWRILNGGR